MYPFYLELELIKPVSDFFKKQGYKVKHEIKIGFCRADLLAFKDDEVVAVELKLKDWKKAVVQAKNYKLAVDYVYLVVPLFRVYNILRKAEHILKKEGIGLLIVKETNCEVCKIIDPKQSKIKTCNITIEEICKRRNLNKRPYYQ
jgi:hypothetical protein